MSTQPQFSQHAAPVVPRTKKGLTTLGIGAVRLEGGFWGERQELNANAMIPHCLKWEERAGWIHNFDAAVAGTITAERQGREFSDSDVYKLLEAMAWELGRHPNPDLQQQFDAIVAKVAACQKPDGYVNTNFGNAGQPGRYTDFEWGHELYTAGHLLQAAIARIRTGFDETDQLVAIGLAAADHICATFDDSGLDKVGGHPEIEVALAELYRASGRRRYLDQAQLFVDRRGHGRLADIEFGRGYFQDDVPVREAEVLRGHAVRALYLTAGAIDVAVESGDDELLKKLQRQYQRTLARRTYVTGGMGSHHQDEAFGADYELPPERAYCETCAGIGSVMVAWRLLLATGDLSYADVIEKTLYNVVAASPAEDGQAFFYTNTLHQREMGWTPASDEISPRANGAGRAAWFEVSCCPTNVSRTLAQLGSYIAAVNGSELQLLQYATGEIEAELATGGVVKLSVETEYPRDGRILVRVLAAPDDAQLRIRIPAWASGATVDDGAGLRSAQAPSHLIDALKVGQTIEVNLPMSPRWLHPHRYIDAARGCVAAARGPLLYCAESIDQEQDGPGSGLGEAGIDVANLYVDPRVVPTVSGSGEFLLASGEVAHGAATAEPVYDSQPSAPHTTRWSIRLRPYYSWGNHGPSTMRVWLPTTTTIDR